VLLRLAGPGGAVTAAQLRAAGFSRSAIGRRTASGLLRRVHRGVYLVGPVDPPRARLKAALLACGPGATLSHRAAAALWRLGALPDGAVDVTVATARGPPGIRTHRMRLPPGEVTHREGLALTTPARTLLDLAAVLGPTDLARALEEAEVLGLAGRPALLGLLARHRGRRGAAALRELLRHGEEPAMTRSEAEARLVGLVRAARLPAPAANARVARHEVDLLWREQRLVVEVDGYRFHSTRAAFERDRRRDAELLAAGFRVIRVTWRQIVDEPHSLVATLARALALAQ